MGMTKTERKIAAPQEDVFKTVAHIDEFSKLVPHIVNVEFLTEQRTGVGTRFKETRLMGKREGTTELEVTEYESPSRIRLVSDEGGTIWDTVFTVAPDGDGSVLTMTMESRPYKLMAKIVTPLISPMIRKAVEKDMDIIKAHFEG